MLPPRHACCSRRASGMQRCLPAWPQRSQRGRGAVKHLHLYHHASHMECTILHAEQQARAGWEWSIAGPNHVQRMQAAVPSGPCTMTGFLANLACQGTQASPKYMPGPTASTGVVTELATLGYTVKQNTGGTLHTHSCGAWTHTQGSKRGVAAWRQLRRWCHRRAAAAGCCCCCCGLDVGERGGG